MSESNGRAGLFTSPSPDPVDVTVGRLTLRLDDPPLEYLEQVFTLVVTDVVAQFARALESRPKPAPAAPPAEDGTVVARADAALEEASQIAWMGQAFSGVVSDVVSRKVPLIASRVLACTPANLKVVGDAKIEDGGLDAENVTAEQFAAWVQGSLRARQVLAMGEALLYMVGVEELGKRWRSIQARLAAAMGRAPAEKTPQPQGSPS